MPHESPFPSKRRAEDGSTIVEWKNGERYQGEMFKDCFHGKGTYTWPDKVSYSGFFYVNKRHGYGRQDFSDGRKFTGLYRDDEQYGAGIMEYPSNNEDVGFWKGKFLYRLCSSHPSIPTYQEVAIGYITGGGKVKKMIDLITDFRKSNPVDEYLNSTDLGSKLTESMRDSLYSSAIPNPHSMFFNQRLFSNIYHKSLAHEKKFLTRKSPGKTQEEFPVKVTKTRKYNNITDLFRPKPTPRKSPVLKITTEIPDEEPAELSSVFQGDELSQEAGKTPDYTEIKPDCPAAMISWNSNPEIIDLQKYCAQYQNFLITVGFPIEKLLSFNRESHKPPGEMESAANQLLLCANDGDVSGAIRLIMNQSVHPDVSDANGNTPLIIATIHCHDEMINFLLDMGVGIDNCNDDGLTPIGICIVRLHPASTLVFHYNSVRLFAEEIIYEYRISTVEKGDKKSKAVPEDATTPSRRMKEKEITNASRLAADDKPTASARIRANLVSKIVSGSPGTSASSKKRTSSEKQIPADDDPKSKCNRRTLPSEIELMTTLKLLLNRGANIDTVMVPANPIMMAIRANNMVLLQLFLQFGANPNLYHQEKDCGRLVPLHLTCAIPAEPAMAMTTALLEHGANPDLMADEDCSQLTDSTDDTASTSTLPDRSVTTEGLTPILIAAARPEPEVALELIKLLLRFKCNPSPPLFSGHSPLSLAIANGHEAMIKTLLVGGADPNLAISEEIGPIVAMVLSSQLNDRWPIGKRLEIAHELIMYKANVVGPFKMGISKRTGTLMDFIVIMFTKDAGEGKVIREEEKNLIFDNLSVFIRNAVRASALIPNRNNAAQRRKLKDEMTTKLPPQNVVIALKTLPTNVLPVEMCYECGRSCGLRLHACARCYSVLYCSRYCQTKSWDECHKDECFANDEIPVQYLKKLSQRIPFECHTTTPSSKTLLPGRPSHAGIPKKKSVVKY